MRREINIQDGSLFQWLKERTQLTIELITGKTLSARIVRFDRFCVLVETEDGTELLIYKHALSGIGAAEPDSGPVGVRPR